MGGRGVFSYRYLKDVYEQSQKTKIIAFFDINKYTDTFNTTTNEVVLTKKSKEHIINEHPEVAKEIENIPNIINNPDMILIDNKNKDTVWVVKKIENNVKITIKINTIGNIKETGYKNSVIQMQYIRDKELKRNIKNKNVSLIYNNKNIELN